MVIRYNKSNTIYYRVDTSIPVRTCKYGKNGRVKMENNGIVNICPGCGAAVPETKTVFCPYCGRELIDLSRENTNKKIEEVKRVQAGTMAIPKKLGLVVAAALFVLFVIFGLILLFDVPEKIEQAGAQGKMDNLSRDLQKAYKREDWDQLEEYLIFECEDYIGAPDYFLYRTAWYLHTYPPLFDQAFQEKDTEEMLWIYGVLAEDYNMRDDGIFFQIYETDDAIEAALKEEVERETEILKEEGLEDEMYKLRF